MNSSYKNHAKIIKLAEEFDVVALYDKYEHGISTGEAYFNLIKEKNFKNMESIFEHLFQTELNCIESGDESTIPGNYLIQIIEFVEANFPNHYFYQKQEVLGKQIIGNSWVPNIERGLRRMDTNPTLHLPPLSDGYETDYATAIEIETTYAFTVPEVTFYPSENKDIVFIGEDKLKSYNGGGLMFFKTERRYDERAYGTHYM